MTTSIRTTAVVLAGLLLVAASNPDFEITEIKRTATESVHRVRVWTQEVPHYHASHDSVVTLLKGSGVLYLNNIPHPLKVGDRIEIPRKVPHYYVHQSTDSFSEAMVVFTPPFDGNDRISLKPRTTQVLKFKPATDRGQVLSPGEKPPATTLEKSKQ